MISRVQLMEKLKYSEWDDIEFISEDSNSLMRVLKTVSAFANTNGGLIVFGVREKEKRYVIAGVQDFDKVHYEILSRIRYPLQISCQLSIETQRIEFDEGTVLCFFINEAPSEAKPVSLNRNMGETYIRRGASNYKCDRDELADFIRNATSNASYDSQPIETNVETFYDEESLSLYRSMIEVGFTLKERTISSVTFLKERGFVVEHKGRQLPTRAAVLLFGDNQHFQQCLDKIVVDLQWYNHPKSEYSSENRWGDREVLEVNLITALQKINMFIDKHSVRPFVIDPKTQQRVDDPPENVCYREAAVNLLVHQDYGNIGRYAVIRIFSDVVEFHNQGNLFAPKISLLQAGEKKLRNPKIVTAFRRARLSKQAGSGIVKIFDTWRKFNYVLPFIEDDKQERTFKLKLPKLKLVEKNEEEIIDKTGFDLSKKEAAVFAYLLKNGEANRFDLMALTGLFSFATKEITDKLISLNLAKRSSIDFEAVALHDSQKINQGQNSLDKPKESNIDQLKNSFSDSHWAILEFAREPRSISELMKKAGLSHRAHFRDHYLKLLIALDLIEMTHSDLRSSPHQKYVTIDAGRQFLTTDINSSATSI